LLIKPNLISTAPNSSSKQSPWTSSRTFPIYKCRAIFNKCRRSTV